MWSESESCFAAASAPVRDARNTGLVELFAIIAIVILFFALAGVSTLASGPLEQPPIATTVASAANFSNARMTLLPLRVRTRPGAGPAGQSAGREPGAPLIHHDRADDGAAD